jgi:L-ascorbate metabolism protein UlaG (beta-lactamase superfamily)
VNKLAFSRLTDWDRTVKYIRQPTMSPQWVTAEAERVSATWIGHVTFLIQLGDVRILTDPVFSDNISPHSWLPPKRFTPPACAIDDLPSVDIVCVSHSHYDHLDLPSIRALVLKSDKQATPIKWVVPLKLGRLLTDHCDVPPERVVQLDWWTATSLSGTCDQVSLPASWDTYATECTLPRSGIAGAPTHAQLQEQAEAAVPAHADLPPCIVAVPAQHNSARTAFDRNETLWSGFAFIAPEGRILFTGDTGYRAVSKGVLADSPEEDAALCNPTFVQVGDRLGPFDIGLMPIGAYSPRVFMSNVHASPEDAVEMHLDARCKRSVGMHWASMPLTDEPTEDPPRRLASALTRRGLEQGIFTALQAGGTMTKLGPLSAAHFWNGAGDSLSKIDTVAVRPNADAAAGSAGGSHV